MKIRRIGAELGPHAREKLAVGGLAFVVGGLLPLLWWGPDKADLSLLEDEVRQLRSRAQSSPPSLVQSSQASAFALSDGPHPEEQTAVWTWLQQGVQAHGLQVQALNALPMLMVNDLPEQPVRLRLHGMWRDWLALTAALDTHAPWWVVDHWQVVPDGQVAGQVRIEVQGRVGFQPQAAAANPATSRDWPVWRHVRSIGHMGAGIFATPEAPGLAAAARAAVPDDKPDSSPLPEDPRLWPVRELQLLGVWWQAGVAHAVLGRGLAQVTVSAGQRIGREGYRVRRINAAGVELLAHGAAERGPVLELTWSGER